MPLSQVARGHFVVDLWPQGPLNDVDGVALGRMAHAMKLDAARRLALALHPAWAHGAPAPLRAALGQNPR